MGGKPLVGGTVRCTANCRFDFSECALADPGWEPEIPSSFVDFVATGVNSHFWFIDELGDADLNTGNSQHRVDVVAERTGPNEWVVMLGMDQRPFGGDKDDFFVFATYLLDFGEDGHPVAVNGIALDAEVPVIRIGGGTSSYGNVRFPGIFAGQEIETPPFENGSAPMEIELNFDDLHVGFFQRFDSANNGTDFIRGAGVHGFVETGPHAGKDIPAANSCSDTRRCALGYNSETMQYETSGEGIDQLIAVLDAKEATLSEIAGTPRAYLKSEWDTFIETVQDEHGLTLVRPLNEEVKTELPDNIDCPDPWFDIDDFQQPDQVVVALDHSGSMADEAEVDATDVSRLDFAKAAGRAFGAFYAPRGVDVGLVWFNDDAEALPAGSGLRSLKSTATDPDEISLNEFNEQLRDSQDELGEFPEAEGLTGIGAALAEAGRLLPDENVSQAVLLLTDGQETMYPDEPGSLDPEAEAQELANRDIKIYTIPAALDADRSTAAELAQMSGGAMYDAPVVTELPGTFFQAYAAQQGQSLARHHTGPEQLETIFDGEIPIVSWTRTIQVEPGARSLELVSWARHSDIRPLEPGPCGDFCIPGVDRYSPTMTIKGPGETGARYVTNDPFFQHVFIENPLPGEWKISTPLGDGTESDSWVAAFIDNPDVRCTVGTSKLSYDSVEGVKVTVTPVDVVDVGNRANIQARLRRPDGSTLGFSVPFDENERIYERTLDPSWLNGRGAYQLIAQCDVMDGTPLHAGENLFQSNDLLPPGTSPHD